MKQDHTSMNAFALMACGMMLCLESVPFALAAQSLDPTEQLRPFVYKIVSILTDPALQGEEMSLTRRDKALKAASNRIDFKEMSKRVLGKKWRQLDPNEKENFVSLFTKLVEHAYIGKIEGYSQQKIEFENQRIKGKRAQVNTKIVDTENVVSVSYIMLLEDNRWMVYDIVVEGVSLVRNYMEQFRAILRKDGYPSLVKQVEVKIAELEKS